MISLNSLTVKLDPLTQKVREILPGDLTKMPRVSEFHLKEGGNSFLIRARIQEILLSDSGSKPSLPDGLLKIEQIAHEDVAQKLSYEAFSRYLSSLPKIESAGASASAGTPTSGRTSFQKRGLNVRLSYEIRQGIAGKRGADHQVSRELLERFVEKKAAALKKAKETEFYLYNQDNKRVLKMVVRYPKDESAVILLTAFYPKDNVLRYMFRSQVAIEAWKGNLPRITEK